MNGSRLNLGRSIPVLRLSCITRRLTLTLLRTRLRYRRLEVR